VGRKSYLKNSQILTYLTPLIPLSFKGEGDMNKRGANAPLKHPPCGYSIKGLKGTFVPLRNSLPSPLTKGRGIKGEGLVKLALSGG